MGTITNIHGIPLFHSANEAIKYGSKWRLKGYHSHSHDLGDGNSIVGYMPGETHEKAMRWFGTTTVDEKKPWITGVGHMETYSGTTTTTTTGTGTTGGSGGGGGGY